MEPQPSIHLHIERIVIDGLPISAADSDALRAGITEELFRLFTDEFHSGPVSAQHLSALPTVAAEIGSDIHPDFGQGIASALHQSLAPVLGTPTAPLAP